MNRPEYDYTTVRTKRYKVGTKMPNELGLYDMSYGPAEWIAENRQAGASNTKVFEPWVRNTSSIKTGTLRLVFEP